MADVNLLDELRTYARFARGLRAFLRRPFDPEAMGEVIRRRLAEREENFLRLVGRGVFGRPAGLYRELFRLAGVEQGDLEALVRREGLDEALRKLRQAGVYVSFEEFKGRAPLVRGGREVPVPPRALDNPFFSPAYTTTTGGSTGAGARIGTDLDYLSATIPNYLIGPQAEGYLHAPLALWWDILPDSAGVDALLRLAAARLLPEKWFSVWRPDESLSPLKFRLATKAILAMLRLRGVRVPRLEPVALDDGAAVARWLGGRLRTEGRATLRTGISRLLRVSLAAREEGIDLSGALLCGGGEPPTPAKVAGIEASGARFRPIFAFTEGSTAGWGCGDAVERDDVHFFTDIMAVVGHRRAVAGAGLEVDAFLFTSLLPQAPKLLINVELDDYGRLEVRPCGCPLGALGLTTHLSGIRSFGKLTGEGVTLVGSDMVRILEEVLPARFGGSPLDYQLAEEEDGRGFTRLALRVHPRVELADEAAVGRAVMEELRRGDFAAGLAGAVWAKADSVRVLRAEPVWTARGKLIPLHLRSRTQAAPNTGGTR